MSGELTVRLLAMVSEISDAVHKTQQNADCRIDLEAKYDKV